MEDRNPVIRVQVDGYHTFAPQNLVKNTGYDPLYGSTHASIAYNTFYDVGPTQVGVWTCGSASFPVSIGQKTFFHLLEGVVIITDNTTGHGRRCVAGDTVVLPEGWSGHLDVSEPAKKVVDHSQLSQTVCLVQVGAWVFIIHYNILYARISTKRYINRTQKGQLAIVAAK